MKKAWLKHAHEAPFHGREKLSVKWPKKRLGACCWWWLIMARVRQRKHRWMMIIFSRLVRDFKRVMSTINVHEPFGIGVLAGEFLNKSSKLRGTSLDLHRARYVDNFDSLFTSLGMWSLAALHVRPKYIHGVKERFYVFVCR